MFCSSQFLLKRCYLLYVFIAIAILLLLFCIYLYKKYTKQNKLEDIEFDMANLQEDTRVMENFEEPEEKISQQISTENDDSVPALIRKPLENEEENEKVKENDKEIEIELKEIESDKVDVEELEELAYDK